MDYLEYARNRHNGTETRDDAGVAALIAIAEELRMIRVFFTAPMTTIDTESVDGKKLLAIALEGTT